MTVYHVDGPVTHQDGDVTWAKMTAADFITGTVEFTADLTRREFEADLSRREFIAETVATEFRRP